MAPKIVFIRGLVLFGIIVLCSAGTALAGAISSFTQIDFPGARSTDARGVNSDGHIAGDFVDMSGVVHGFLYTGSSYIMLDVPSASLTMAIGINSTSQIVGAFDDPLGSHGFLYSKGGFSTIDVPTAIGETIATGINDQGQIVGGYCTDITACFGFLYADGSFSTVNVPGAYYTDVNGINNKGQIVGDFTAAGAVNGFLYAGWQLLHDYCAWSHSHNR